jgi:hypothetical protein
MGASKLTKLVLDTGVELRNVLNPQLKILEKQLVKSKAGLVNNITNK